MRQSVLRATLCFAIFTSFFSTMGRSVARDGEPLAIRMWPNQTVSVETQWGLVFAVHGEKELAAIEPKPDQATHISAIANHVLSRLPNSARPKWLPRSGDHKDPNQIAVTSIGSGLVSIAVDGVLIVVASKESRAENAPAGPADVLLLLGPNAEVAELAAKLKPRYVLVSASQVSNEGRNKVQALIDPTATPRSLKHNTFAISAAKSRARLRAKAPAKPALLVSLTESPWEMNAKLAKEFAAMEKDCADSQAVFSKLSTKQMNFKPSNGTHTPRWNTEHMMGRQLLFFSQIYHELDPEIPVMDLNPRQMPKDYVYAHPDWTGAEESRQMRRVSDFCRRFAYLLEGQELDKRAPGSRWPSMRALLLQMQRHYSEHTANTVKKFDLPDWPKQ